MTKTSGTTQPIISGPDSLALIKGSSVPLGVTISDTNQPHAGNCSLSMSCTTGLLSLSGAIGVTSISVNDTFANCQAALANTKYTSSVVGSDVVTVGMWNQLGQNSNLATPVVVSNPLIVPVVSGVSSSGFNVAFSGLLPQTTYTLSIISSTDTRTATVNVTTSGAGVKAARIADMMERFGVNTFSSTSATSNTWGSYPADYSTASVVAAVQYLTGASGLTMNAREYHYASKTWQAAWCQTVFAATGTQFTMAIGANGSVSDVASMVAMTGGTGWLKWVEGLNEPNTNFGSGAVLPATTIAIQQAVNAATGATIVGPSIVFGLPFPEGYIVPSYASTAQMGQIVAASNVANVHFYPPHQCDIDDSSGRGGAFNDVVQGLATVYTGQPAIITEWHPTLYNSDAHGLDPVYDAYYAPCFFLSAFRLNVLGWFWYALFDFGTSFMSGLFPKTGGVAPRPVANTIRAMFTLTGDTGATKRTFTPGNLGYTVSGLPAPLPGAPNTGGHSMLFQNSAGTFFLHVWNAQNTPEGATVPVTINFDHAVTSVKQYKVSDAVSPTALLQSVSNATSVTIQLNASVHLLVITS